MAVLSLQLKIDIHVHTVSSKGVLLQGERTVEAILETAKEKRLDGLFITDYYSLDSYWKARSYDSGLLILPGFEVRTDAGHILVLGLERLPYNVEYMSYEELTEFSRDRGGVSVLAHPAVEFSRIDEWMRARPDAVEVFNALYPFSGYFIEKGLRVAEKLGVPAVGGSDAHSVKAVGDAYTIVETNGDSVGDVVEAIKAGCVRYGGKLSPLFSRLKVGLQYVVYIVRGDSRR